MQVAALTKEPDFVLGYESEGRCKRDYKIGSENNKSEYETSLREERKKDRRKEKRFGFLRSFEFTRNGLKWFCMGSMLLYTFGMSVIRMGILHLDTLSADGLNQLLKTDQSAMLLAGAASFLQLVGALAIPVFAFMLAEGMCHTSDYSRYLLRMFLFAVLSEIPFDLAMQGKWLDFSAQNPLFTMSVCLIMLYGLRLLEGKKGAGVVFLRIILVMAAVLWCQLFRFQFGLVTVLLSAVYYGFRERYGMRILMGCGISAAYVTAPFSAYVLYNYNGLTGHVKNKYLYYIFYPAHLLIFGLITMLIRQIG